MQGSATFPSAGGGPRPSLAQRAFPRRVRALLEGVLEYVSDELDRGLSTTLNELEQHFFRLAEQARNNDVQRGCMEALREVKRGRADLIPRFLIGLEAALAGIKDPRRDAALERVTIHGELSLVEDRVMDENITLNEIAGRAEIRSSLPLFLLGQRFGVIAGRPAMDAETLPVGPHMLCRLLRDAAGCLDLGPEYRQALFRQFDRSVMQYIAPLYEALNTYLVRQRVLAHLTYVPLRVKPMSRAAAAPAGGDAPATTAAAPGATSRSSGSASTPRARGSEDAGGHAPAPAGSAPSPGRAHESEADVRASAETAAAIGPSGVRPDAGAPPGLRPMTSWPGVPNRAPSPQAQQDSEMFDVLRQLLAGRRTLLGKLGTGKSPNGAPTHTVTPQQLQTVLGALQVKPPVPVVVDGKVQARTITHLKQDLLAQLRQVTPQGAPPALPEEQGDTIDLVGMLFDHMMKDVKPNSPASMLLNKLQVPLLRVALDDKGFFTRKQHPARQMLNTIAESGAYWNSEDEADRGMVEKMHMLVDRVSKEFSGDLTLFDALLGDLNSHMQTQARKAEVAERRHVEAARGKEKLELARIKAAEAIDARLAGKTVPKFLHSLLAQSWSDVLSLSLLRGGEESETFRDQLTLAERLIDSAVSRRKTGRASISATEIPAIKSQIEDALSQVGYHANDAQAISNRLLAASGDEEDDDPASRTELAIKLKNRTRLGQSAENAGPGDKVAPLTPEERACYDQLRHLPFGSWFEFVINQQGEVARRRLSWYSTVTGHCLFVNHRGQRIADYSLNWLAREMRRGNLRVVDAEQDSMIDRAWSAIVGALRSFAGKPALAPH